MQIADLSDVGMIESGRPGACLASAGPPVACAGPGWNLRPFRVYSLTYVSHYDKVLALSWDDQLLAGPDNIGVCDSVSLH